MPLAGGAADKYGGRYEGLWTISRMADVMAERADSIYLEPPGKEGEGVALSALNDEAVLTNFFEKLNDPEARYVFVSADSVPQLRELAERARDAGSWPEFDRHFLEADEWRQRFGELRNLWGDPEPTEAFDRLRRIIVSTM